MLKVSNVEVMNFENAIRGMRNPLNSWDKSDSEFCDGLCIGCNEIDFACQGKSKLGENDLDLAKRLCKAGSDHRKFLRQIMVSVDILAPLYWWKEFDTYKCGTVANSCSTMHKIHSKPIELSDFSFDNFDLIVEEEYYCNSDGEEVKLSCELSEYLDDIIYKCETLRNKYLETNDKKYWRALIQLLPNSYNQLRTVTLNYEVLRNMYHARKNHKLTEWSVDFVGWIETLPYAKELIVGEE